MTRSLRKGLFLIGIFSVTLFAQTPSANLKQELAAQHFSGLLKGDVHFTTLGTLPCGNKRLRVIFYEWYESNHPGEAIHASLRVILMDRTTYIGSYVVEDKPTIQRNELHFPYQAYGNSIRCSKDSEPPQKAWLNGEIIPLSK